MIKLRGEYDVSVDPKGRFLLPAAFKKQLPEGMGDRFIINRGFDNCLSLYTIDVWDHLTEKLNRVNELKPKLRQFKRMFMNGVTEVTLDSADRILLPKTLMEFAGIKKDLTIYGQGNKAELWDKDSYNNYLKQDKGIEEDALSKLASEVADEIGNIFENS